MTDLDKKIVSKLSQSNDIDCIKIILMIRALSNTYAGIIINIIIFCVGGSKQNLYCIFHTEESVLVAANTVWWALHKV